MTEDNKKDTQLKRQRSPWHPYFSLRRCVDFVKKLYAADGFSEVPYDIAAKRFRFSSKSSSFQRAISSLLSFGLLEDRGAQEQKVVWLSHLGKRVVLHEKRDDAPEHLKALREAALKDNLVVEALNRWPTGLPANDTIESTLLLEMGFKTDGAATRFAQVLRDTLEFAQLPVVDDMKEPSELKEQGESMPRPAAMTPERLARTVFGAPMREYAIPLIDGTAILKLPVPTTKNNLALISGWLKTMETALTYTDEDDENGN